MGVTDNALCTELDAPINKAVDTTLEYSEVTPAPVINAWTTVIRGFDAGCKRYK